MIAEYNTYGNGSLINLSYKPDNEGEWQKYYNINDHLGNVRAVIKSCPQCLPPDPVMEETDYEPFEAVFAHQGSGTERTGFINKEKDVESQTHNFGVRQYDDYLGRFLCPDKSLNN